MSWLLPAAIGSAVIGGIKHFASDVPEYKHQAKAVAATQRYSPWTGRWANLPSSKPSLLGSMLQTGLTGAMVGQGIDSMANKGTTDNIINPNTIDLDPELDKEWLMQNRWKKY